MEQNLELIVFLFWLLLFAAILEVWLIKELIWLKQQKAKLKKNQLIVMDLMDKIRKKKNDFEM